LIKEAIQASLETPLAEGLRLETSLFGVAFASEDKREGVRAFLEKRPPAFKGQ
jgi:enoyl-CoA hydratase/carnithine racemase